MTVERIRTSKLNPILYWLDSLHESSRFYRMDMDKHYDQSVDLTMSEQTNKHVHGTSKRSDSDPNL